MFFILGGIMSNKLEATDIHSKPIPVDLIVWLNDKNITTSIIVDIVVEEINYNSDLKVVVYLKNGEIHHIEAQQETYGCYNIYSAKQIRDSIEKYFIDKLPLMDRKMRGLVK